MEAIETYNGGLPFRNITGAMEREVKVLSLDTENIKDIKKRRASAQGKQLAVAFLISLYWRRYRELIIARQNDHTTKKNYPKTMTEIYALMVALKPTRVAPVARGFNDGINF